MPLTATEVMLLEEAERVRERVKADMDIVYNFVLSCQEVIDDRDASWAPALWPNDVEDASEAVSALNRLMEVK